MSSPSPAKPPIRVGQLWRDRTGTTHRITGVQLTATRPDGTDFPLRFPVTADTGCSYTLAGTEWTRRYSHNDLIELVCDVSPDASEAAKPPIRVGQSWLTRDNRLAIIESTTDRAISTYPIRACVHNAAGTDSVSYTPDGHCWAHRLSTLDLITLVTDVSNYASEAVRPQLRVGQVWRDRSGITHRITHGTPIITLDDGTTTTLNYPIRCDRGTTYTLDGAVWRRRESDGGLIELVSDANNDASDAATPEVNEVATPEPALSEAAKPELRVGQVWRDRNGDLHTIVVDDGTDIYSLRASNGHWYTRNGEFVGSGHTHTFDLIELVSEAGEAATPATPNAAKPPLRVGQTWRDRTSATHTIIYDDNTKDHPLLCDNQCWYKRDGRSIIHDMSPEIELVELVHDTDEPAKPTTPDASKPPTAYVIAISHGPDVVSRVMSDGSAWYAPTHHGIPTGPWTRYAD